MLTLLMLLVGAFGAYLYLVSPSRVAKLAGDLLAGMSGTDVRINSARFGLDGTITLHGLEMRIKGVEGNEGRLFDAEQVLIKHDLLSLIEGTFQAQLITFIKPTLHLTENPEAGRFNFQYLQQQRRDQSPDMVLGTPPEIFIRNGRVRFGELEGGRYRVLGTVHVEGNFTASPDESSVYFFALRQGEMGRWSGEGGPELTGRLDLEGFVVWAKLERFVFEGPQRSMLPRNLRRWWDLLEPVGSVPSVRFGYDPDPESGFHADLELNGVSITLPYGELDSRMTDVSGWFSIVNESITITDLTGQIEGIRYTIDGRVDGFTRDVPFQLSVRTEPFSIPEKPRYMFALPTGVQQQFKLFNPSGMFKALVVLERRKPGDRVSYDGTVEISDAKILYEKFRYPLENVRGELRFNDERIEIVGLRGRGPTGANVAVNGSIAPPKANAAVHVILTAVDSPIDDALYEAMPEKHQKVLDMFMNRKAHETLLERGLIQTSQQQAQRLEQLNELRSLQRSLEAAKPVDREALADLGAKMDRLRRVIETPVFELGGIATVVAQSSRSPGENQRFRTTVGLKVAGVNALLAFWPYPVRGTAGQLLIKPDEVVVDGIELEGLTGATGKITGRIGRSKGRKNKAEPDLVVTIPRMPMDGFLLASIPEPQGQWLRDLYLKGVLAAQGTIFRSEEEDEVDFRIKMETSRSSLRPYEGLFEIEQLEGSVTLGRFGLWVKSLEGRRGPTRLTLSGSAIWGGPKPRMDMALNIKDLNIDQAALDLLPPDSSAGLRVRRLYDEHKPTGVLDAHVQYKIEDEQAADYRLDVRFGELGFNLHGQQIDIDEISGEFAVTPRAVEFADWGGSFGTGQFVASGAVGFGPRFSCDLTFDVQSSSIGPVTRAWLPRAAVSVVDGLALEGAYTVKGAHLKYQSDDGEHTAYEFQGTARLTDASAVVGIPITDMTGDLEIHATGEAGAQWPRLDMNFYAERLLAAKRLTSPLSLRIVTTERPDRLAIKDLWGGCYGGKLLGSGEIQLGEQGFYRMSLVLQDVALNPFLYPEKAVESSDVDDDDQAGPMGILAASLAIEGGLDHSNSRRGRGELEIRNANLYEVPLALALIQLLNLSLPSARAFDRAYASYVLDDDLVWFDTVRFEAPTIQVVGGGLMQYSTLELDLDLYTRNPESPELGALSDLFTVFKDELLSIHVGGTLDEPDPQASSFQGIKRSWREIFGNNKKVHHQPLPGVRETPTTPGQ